MVLARSWEGAGALEKGEVVDGLGQVEVEWYGWCGLFAVKDMLGSMIALPEGTLSIALRQMGGRIDTVMEGGGFMLEGLEWVL